MIRLKQSFDKTKSIYLQIIDEIKKAVVRGELGPGSQIPSQREFATLSHVNPNTVQRAYREMESMGLLETARGQGTFICNKPGLTESIREEMAGELLTTFIDEMLSIGIEKDKMLHMLQERFGKPDDGGI